MKTKNIYPIKFNGEWLHEEDCNEIFVCLYHDRYILRNDMAVYIGDGSWVFPDGSFEHDDNR